MVRHGDQLERELDRSIISLGHRKTGNAEGVGETWSTKFFKKDFGFSSFKMEALRKIVDYCVGSHTFLVTSEQFKDTLVVFR